jgi:hypothetical protein
MLYTAVPGTPLHREHGDRGTLLDIRECPDADIHGQFKFNFRHPHIRGGKETEFLLNAFNRDFFVNGPSILRITRTVLQGWKRYKSHPSGRIRRRFAWEARDLSVRLAGALWAAKRSFRSNAALSARITSTLKEIHRELGLKSRLTTPFVGRYLRIMIAREERRLKRGWTYEPPTFYETKPSAP